MDIRMVTSIDANNPVLGDWYLDETATIPMVDGNEAIAQHVVIRLKRFRGEWFLNLLDGIPREEVLGKIQSKSRVKRVLSQVVLGTPGIASLEGMDVDIDGDTRVMTVSNLRCTTDSNVVLGPESFGDMEIKF